MKPDWPKRFLFLVEIVPYISCILVCRLIEQLKSLVKSKDLIIEQQEQHQQSVLRPLEKQIDQLQKDVQMKDQEIQVRYK